MSYRQLHGGMGTAVFNRTVQRGEETWGDASDRTSTGNAMLIPATEPEHRIMEKQTLHYHTSRGHLLWSGRHLQHGDEDQPSRNMEVFTNCSCAATSYAKFYLLLNGSGVGRIYDDDMMAVNWDNAPNIRCVLDENHADFYSHSFESKREAQRKYPHCMWHEVEDSREGWAHAMEVYESLTWEGTHKDKIVVFDFSKVRPSGSPINGMQDRPASGPAPLMKAFEQIQTLKGIGWEPWEQTMWVDHYLADCVLVGGVRRSARIAGKYWKDPGIFRFINIKRPNELQHLHTVREIQDARKEKHLQGFLWTANNSVCVDDEFWESLEKRDPHAVRVFEAIAKASYADGTGEPGIVNLHKLHADDTDMEMVTESNWFGSPKFQPMMSKGLLKDITDRFKGKKYKFFVNPCGEIVLSIIGAFCVIADVVPFHCSTDEEAEDAFRAATRALIRVNTMPSVYQAEVRRTNRIGVGLTGIHEYAYARFGYSFRDLIDEEKSQDFWQTLARFSQAVRDEAKAYSESIGVACPHTFTTVKPAGCRPSDALTSTSGGLLTLDELFTWHDAGEVWAEQQDGFSALGSGDMISRTFVNGKAPVKTIRMAYGLEVESTHNHPWFVKDVGWVPTEDITPGMILDVQPGVYANTEPSKFRRVDSLAIRMRGNFKEIRQPEVMTEDLAWLLGYLWGDGAMSPTKYRLRWMDANNNNLHKANRILSEYFGISGNIVECNDRKASTLEVGNKHLWHWLLANDVYKYHADEIDRIPRIVRGSSRDHIIAFVAGLLDADGAIARTPRDKTYMITTASESFAKHLQDVCWSVGLCIGRSLNSKGSNWQQPRKSMWLMTGAACVKHEHLDVLIRNSTKMSGEKSSTPWRAETKTPRRIPGKVEEVFDSGEKETYDIEVENSHWFFAGAVKSHNTTSKLFGLTEGVHLPAMGCYMRWVQFSNTDPKLQKYKDDGYPTRKLKTYKGTTIVGFPTKPTICDVIPEDRIVYAGDATPQEQYQWLRLLEKYWIGESGNQISYTLKYKPEKVSYEAFKEMVRRYQPTIKCCSVMPQEELVSHEYQPEEPLTLEQYEEWMSQINPKEDEDVGREHVECAGGACPIDFKQGHL